MVRKVANGSVFGTEVVCVALAGDNFGSVSVARGWGPAVDTFAFASPLDILGTALAKGAGVDSVGADTTAATLGGNVAVADGTSADTCMPLVAAVPCVSVGLACDCVLGAATRPG